MNDEAIKIDWRIAIIGVFLILVIVGLILAIGSLDSIRQGDKQASSGSEETAAVNQERNEFLGEKGGSLQAEGERVYIDEAKVADGNLHAFNYYSSKAEKTIYFFIVRASDGTYRAAANACEVCFESLMGFRQVGERRSFVRIVGQPILRIK